jgi:hypothetical protein
MPTAAGEHAAHGIRLVRVGEATTLAEDEGAKPPEAAMAALTAGGLVPFRVLSAPGLYWILLREPAKTKKEPSIPQQRLRVWRAPGDLVSALEVVNSSSDPGFDAEGRRALLGVFPNALWEFDLTTGEGGPLSLSADTPRLVAPGYLADGRILFEVLVDGKRQVRVCSRAGDALELRFAFPIAGRYVIAEGRALVHGLDLLTVTRIGPTGPEVLAEIPVAPGLCQLSFDGRLLRYATDGCHELVGVKDACAACDLAETARA